MSVSEKDICLQIQLRFINPLKNLRRLGIKMISDIFLDWESYQFRAEEIDAVFHGAVWPQVNLDLISPPFLTLSTFPSVFIHQHSPPPGRKGCLLCFLTSRLLFLQVVRTLS